MLVTHRERKNKMFMGVPYVLITFSQVSVAELSFSVLNQKKNVASSPPQ